MAEGLVIIGAGGHAKVVAATALAIGVTVRGFTDSDSARHGSTVLGLPILGDDISVLRPGTHAVIAIGDNRVRKLVASKYQCAWQTLVHPLAYVHPSCILGVGSVVFAGAIVQPDGRIGEHCIVNTASSIDHDAILEAFVHVAPGTHLAGNVTLREGAFLGVGVSVIPERVVGAWSTVGAGSTVVRDIADSTTVVGVPARPLQ